LFKSVCPNRDGPDRPGPLGFNVTCRRAVPPWWVEGPPSRVWGGYQKGGTALQHDGACQCPTLPTNVYFKAMPAQSRPEFPIHARPMAAHPIVPAPTGEPGSISIPRCQGGRPFGNRTNHGPNNADLRNSPAERGSQFDFCVFHNPHPGVGSIGGPCKAG